MSEDQLLDRTKEIVGDLIAFPSISSDSNLDIIAYLADRLEDAGADVATFQDNTGKKANLFATLGPGVDGGIVLSGHTDVVPVDGQEWSSDPFRMTEENRRLYGRGACDMKGFIAATVAMAPSFAALSARRPLHFAFTYDEEIGCFGAQALMTSLDAAEVRPAVAIIGEPTEMRAVDAHKGCYEYTTIFKGRGGHSSMPDDGVSAIEYAVRFMDRLFQHRDELKAKASAKGRFEPPYTTMHVGRIDGGTARNVIPRHCRVDWEIRPIQRQDADEVKAAIAAFVETNLKPTMKAVDDAADITTEIICEVEGLEPERPSLALDLITELTGANSTHVVSFGTEAGLFQRAGISSIICGPGSIEQAHKADEYIDIDQIRACLAMLDKLKTKLV